MITYMYMYMYMYAHDLNKLKLLIKRLIEQLTQYICVDSSHIEHSEYLLPDLVDRIGPLSTAKVDHNV